MNDLPLLWRWIVTQGSDPETRGVIIDAVWKLLVVGAMALAAEWAGRRLLRRLRAAVSARARHGAAPPPPGEDPAAPGEPSPPASAEPPPPTETTTAARARRFDGALSAFRRLPFLIFRLMLDLVPLVLFAVVANVLMGTRLGSPASSRAVILLVAESYLAARLILLASDLLVSSATPRVRLLHVSDWAAEFLTRWVRRITIIAITSYATSGVGAQFGMYRTANEALVKLFALVIHICLVVAVLQAREPVARRIHARQGATGLRAITLNRLADIWHLLAIFFIVALWLVWAVELRNGYVRLLRFFVVTALVLVLARLAAIVLLGALDRTKGLPAITKRLPGLEERALAYYPLLRAGAMALITGATLIALFEVWGFGFIGWFAATGLGSRIIAALVLIGVTVVLALLVWEGVNVAIDLHLARLSKAAHYARAARLRTLLPMLRAVLLVTILVVVALMTLDQLGVNIAPLLAGAGVIGIAVGFGSQKLVQDLITGLFLLLENAMQVGDVVTLGGLSGTVEALSIRTIRLRALDGSVHIIPFSAVTTVTNQTRDYGFAVLDVAVGLNEEPEPIIALLQQVAATMRAEPRWESLLLEPLDIMGVDRFIDLAWIMRVRIKTQPASRWSVARELNRRIKEAFDEQAIESPITSHRVLSTVPPPAAPEPNAIQEGSPA